MHATNKARPARAAAAASAADMGVRAPSPAARAVLSIPPIRGDGSSPDFESSNGNDRCSTVDVLGGLMA